MKLAKMSIALIIAMLFLPLVSVYAAVPPDNNAMWIEPTPSINLSTATVSPGYRFNITVWLKVTDALDVFGYQVALRYNRTYLKGTKAGFTAGIKSQFMSGHTTSTSGPTIDTSFLGNGSVLAFESCQSPDTIPVPKTDSLVWIEFEVMLAPNKGENLTAVFDITTETNRVPPRNWVQDLIGNPISFVAYNLPYAYGWAPPGTNPRMSIEHGGYFGVSPNSPIPAANVWPITYGPYPPSVIGSGFVASIYVDNLAAAWYMTNCSFRLTWNNTILQVIGGLANVSMNLAWGTGTPVIGPGTLDIFVDNYSPAPPSGKVLVATVVFTIVLQELSPPKPTGYYDQTDLTFSDVHMYDHSFELTRSADINGRVRVYAMQALPLPWLEVNPTTTVIGGVPSIGEEFEVTVEVKGLHFAWYVVAIQFRLSYDPAILEVVEVTEGAFMQNTRWNKYGTIWVAGIEPPGWWFPQHVRVLTMISPNTTNGEFDQNEFPNTINPPAVDPTLATVKFKILQQECFGGDNITVNLDIYPFWMPDDHHFIDKDANYVTTDTSKIKNGTVVITPLVEVGRVLDVYGGAKNDGYWTGYPDPFPAPYGGQGQNHWMDLVFPQSEITLYTNLTYNYWPIQSKDIGYEIEGPFEKLPNGTLVPKQRYQIWAKLVATTDENGVATITFRMPWPCEDPDGITGIYKVTSTATVADEIVMDTMIFYYERVVYITSVTTDKYGYMHEEYVKVTVCYKTHAVMTYPALFAIVITDDLGVPFGMALHSTTIGGAEFCTWKEDCFEVSIFIPKWAYAGNGYVHVSVYDKDPTEGGEPYAREYEPLVEINIYPY